MKISKSTWFRIIRLLAPIIIARTVPHGKLLAPIAAAGIEEAENMSKATGADKLKHVSSMIEIGARAANATGKVAIDVEKTTLAAEAAISVVVDLANKIESQTVALETIHKSVVQ